MSKEEVIPYEQIVRMRDSLEEVCEITRSYQLD